MKFCINHPDRPALESRRVCAECHTARVRELQKGRVWKKRPTVSNIIKQIIEPPEYWETESIITKYICGAESKYVGIRPKKTLWSSGGIPVNTKTSHYF